MPQNQFDKWLRDKVNPYESSEGLDQEWSMIQSRLNQKKERRPLFFWLWSGAALIGLLVSSTLIYHKLNVSASNDQLVNMTTSEINNIQNSENAPDHVIANTNLDINKSPSLKSTPGDISSTSSTGVSQNIATTTISSSSSSTKVKDNPVNKSLVKAKSAHDHSSTLDASEKTAVGNQKFQLGISSFVNQKQSEVDRPLGYQSLSILVPIKGIEFQHDLERPNSLKAKSAPSKSWHLEMAMHIGQAFSSYESKNDQTSIEAFEHVEDAHEFIALDVRAFKGLGHGWWLGSGVELGYTHITSQQSFIDTVSGALHNQIVKIREDRNGNKIDIIGTTNGRSIYDIERKRHQIHASLSIPVTIKYDYSVHRHWFVSGELGLASTIYNYRQGKSIISDEKDILELDLKDRYAVGYRGSLLAGVMMNHHLNDKVSLSFGVRGQKELFGTESIDGLWSQKLSNIALRAGMRYTL